MTGKCRYGCALRAALLVLVASCDLPEERAPSWSYIHAAVIQPNCATSNCHSNLGGAPIGTSTAGLAFDQREGTYVLLTGHVCDDIVAEAPPGNLVRPGQPESSKLMYLLRGDEVDRMPPDAPLPEGEIELIEHWILVGAPCN
jgi:hypothetical protein